MTTTATTTALVDADWAQAHLDDPNVRFVEVDVDTTAYEQSHLPGRGRLELDEPAVRRRSAATSRRARTSRALLSESGIGPDTTIVLYGDNNNWFAAWAYWQLKLYGHRDVRIIDGGRKYWLDQGLPLTTDVPSLRRRPATSCPRPTSRCAPSATTSCRAWATRAGARRRAQSPAEFNGEIIAPPGMSETAQRAGHIPGAASHPVGPDRRARTARSRIGRRAGGAVRGQGRDRRQGRHRLLPHRRALEPLVVRAARAARLRAGPQLRRLAGPSTAASSACRSRSRWPVAVGREPSRRSSRRSPSRNRRPGHRGPGVVPSPDGVRAVGRATGSRCSRSRARGRRSADRWPGTCRGRRRRNPSSSSRRASGEAPGTQPPSDGRRPRGRGGARPARRLAHRRRGRPSPSCIERRWPVRRGRRDRPSRRSGPAPSDDEPGGHRAAPTSRREVRACGRRRPRRELASLGHVGERRVDDGQVVRPPGASSGPRPGTGSATRRASRPAGTAARARGSSEPNVVRSARRRRRPRRAVARRSRGPGRSGRTNRSARCRARPVSTAAPKPTRPFRHRSRRRATRAASHEVRRGSRRGPRRPLGRRPASWTRWSRAISSSVATSASIAGRMAMSAADPTVSLRPGRPAAAMTARSRSCGRAWAVMPSRPVTVGAATSALTIASSVDSMVASNSRSMTTSPTARTSYVPRPTGSRRRPEPAGQAVAGREGDEQVAAGVAAGAADPGDAQPGPLGEPLALVRQERRVGRDDDDDRAGAGRRLDGPCVVRAGHLDSTRDRLADPHAVDAQPGALAVVGLDQHPDRVAAVVAPR